MWFAITLALGQNAFVKDLQSAKLMWLKAVLFLVIGTTSVTLVWLEVPSVKNAALLALSVWGFCRAYYFAFYVLEKYVDSSFKFAGLWSLARYILQNSRNATHR